MVSAGRLRGVSGEREERPTAPVAVQPERPRLLHAERHRHDRMEPHQGPAEHGARAAARERPRAATTPRARRRRRPLPSAISTRNSCSIAASDVSRSRSPFGCLRTARSWSRTVASGRGARRHPVRESRRPAGLSTGRHPRRLDNARSAVAGRDARAVAIRPRKCAGRARPLSERGAGDGGDVAGFLVRGGRAVDLHRAFALDRRDSPASSRAVAVEDRAGLRGTDRAGDPRDGSLRDGSARRGRFGDRRSLPSFPRADCGANGSGKRREGETRSNGCSVVSSGFLRLGAVY